MNKKTENKLAAKEEAEYLAKHAQLQAEADAKTKAKTELIPFINLASMSADDIISGRMKIVWTQLYRWEREAKKATNKLNFVDEETAMAVLSEYSAYSDLDKFMDHMHDHVTIARTNRDGYPIEHVPSIESQIRSKVTYKVAALVKEYF